MKTQAEWFAEYAVSHQNPKNIAIHKVCVPSIEWSVLGMMWVVKLGPVNLAQLFWLGALAFYFRLSVKAGILAGGVAALMLASLAYLEAIQAPIFWISIGVFVVAWIGQFIGHAIEGKKPSFIQDLQFLLIGPIWVMKRWI